MKRLRDQRDSQDALTARVAELVSSVGPTLESPARMRRIRRRLDQRPRSFTWRALRPLAAFVFVFGGAATAAAAYGVAQLIVPRVDTTDEASEIVASPVTTSKTRARQARAVAEAVSTDVPTEASTTEAIDTEAIATDVPASSLPSSDAARSSVRRTAGKSSVASEARVVQRGLEALRNEKDPKKAAAYLDEYRRKHPDGALAEEALALSVEAATTSGDPRARRLATEYLTRYPSGRFREAARRALVKPAKAAPAGDKASRSAGRK